MKQEPPELPDDEDEYEEMGESIPNLKIRSIELAIKAVEVSGGHKEPENILQIAKDFYEFIAEDEENE